MSQAIQHPDGGAAEMPIPFGHGKRKWVFDNFCDFLYEHNDVRNLDNQLYQMFPYQQSAGWRAAKSVLTRKGWEIFWVFARQMGKTEVGAMTSIFLSVAPHIFRDSKNLGATQTPPWFLYSRGIHGAVFAPTMPLTKWMFDRIKDRLRYRFLEERFGLDVDMKSQVITIRGETGHGDEFTSTISRFSASKEAKQEGATLSYAFLDEAQDIPDLRVVKSIYPMFATTGGTRVLMGSITPEYQYYFTNRVAEERRRDRNDELCRNLYFKDWTHRGRYDETYKRTTEAEIEKHGADSPFIQTQYLLQIHVLSKTTKFIRRAPRLTDLRYGEIERASNEHVAIGVDAGQISDSTIITVTRYRGRRTINWLELRGDEYPQQEMDIRDFLRNYPNIGIIFGEAQAPTGVLLQYLRNPPRDSSMPSYQDRVHMEHLDTKLKSEIYNYVLQGLIDGSWSYPATDTVERRRFEQQYLALEKNYTPGGLLKAAHPKGRDKHDDYCDSHAFSIFATEIAPLFTLEDLDAIEGANDPEPALAESRGIFRDSARSVPAFKSNPDFLQDRRRI